MSGSRSARPRRYRLAAATLMLAVCWALVPVADAHAELAVLTNGSVLKIDGYRLEGDRMRLELATGGSLTLAIGRVERIVDDEVARPEPPPAIADQPAADETALLPRFTMTWDGAESVPATPYGELIFAAAERHQLNPRLLAAMARAESAYDAGAVSPKGARGLLQLMPATAQRFGVRPRELFDPARNLEAASRYLRYLIAEFDGDLERVLAAYNAGEGVVARYGGVPPYRETRGYISRIYRFLGLEKSS